MHDVRHTKRVAIKQHRCEWCGEHIEPGEMYFVYVGKYHGLWQTTKMHDECEAAAKEQWQRTGSNTFERRVNQRGKKLGVVGVESLF